MRNSGMVHFDVIQPMVESGLCQQHFDALKTDYEHWFFQKNAKV